jgi:hypothetical protein
MKRRGFLGKLLMGAAATALAPMATIEPKKIQVIPPPKPDYTNITVGDVERMRIGPGGYVIWPGTDKEFKI